MTVPEVTPAAHRSLGNGINLDFPFDFAIKSVTEVLVLIDDVPQPYGSYTVSGAGTTNGGNVHFSVAPPDQSIVTRLRAQPISQLVNLPANSSYEPLTIGDALDRHTEVDQMLAERIGRALKYRVDSSIVDPQLPTPVNGKFLQFAGTNGDIAAVEGTSVFNPGGSTTLVINVKSYGALGNGVQDDRPFIQAVIDALPVTGGVIYFPTGVYLLGGALVLGNGTNSADSGRHGIRLIGEGNSIFVSESATVLRRTSGTGPVITVAGPIRGVEIGHMTLDANNTSDIGLQTFAMRGTNIHDITIVNYMFHGLHVNARANALGGAFGNAFRNIQMASLATGATGLFLHGDVPNFANATVCVFDNVFIFFHGGVTSFGAILRFTDGNSFNNLHIVAANNSGGAPLFLDAQDAAAGFPGGNVFVNFVPTHNAVQWQGNIGPNHFVSFDDTNGAVAPVHINLSGTTRSGKNFGYLALMCQAKRATGQTVPNNAFTTVILDQEEFDVYGMHSTTVNPTKITALKAGTYRVTASSAWAPSATGYRSMTVAKNSVGVVWLTDQRPGDATDNIATLSGYVVMAVGDFIELSLYQNSGGPLGITQATMSLEYTGA